MMVQIECGAYAPAPGFDCTGSDESHIWKMFHDENGDIGPLMEKFDCGTCQIHAHKIFKGVHSLVSLGIGKPLVKPEYKKAFLDLKKDIDNVYQTAKGDGRL